MLEKDPDLSRCVMALQACHAGCLRSIAHMSNNETKGISAYPVVSMLDCAEICQLAISFLMRESDHYVRICLEVIEICRDIILRCEGLTDMDGVVHICLQCISACRKIVS